MAAYRAGKARARNALRKVIRRRRRRRGGRRPLTNRKLTTAVRHLQKASEIKRTYFHLDNVSVTNGNGAVQNGSFVFLNLCEIPVVTAAGVAPAIELGRGQNTEKVLVKNLHIRMSMHASVGDARPDTNKYAIYLVRSELTQLGAQTTDTTVRPPTLVEFFDYDADFTSSGNLLEPCIDGFRNSADDAIQQVKVLKKWTGIISPSEYDLADPNNPIGTENTYEVPMGNTYKPQRTYHYSTRQLNCEVKFPSAIGANATEPSNQAYYLLAVCNCNEIRGEFLKWNVSVATTYKDD